VEVEAAVEVARVNQIRPRDNLHHKASHNSRHLKTRRMVHSNLRRPLRCRLPKATLMMNSARPTMNALPGK